MKLKRRRAVEVPPKIKSFINNVTSTPLDHIEESLKNFVWEFEKGDFHHWCDLFNHFDTFFEKCIKPRKDLQLDNNFLESEPPFPREAVLQILRVIRIILENCTNKHLYSSYEHHLSGLLASTDADVVEASLQTLAAFLKKTIGKYIIRDTSLKSKLFAFARGWGGKEEGLGLVACVVENGSDPIAHELGCTLHFEFYSVNESSDEVSSAEQQVQGLKVIHLPDVNTRKESDLDLLNKLVIEYNVPLSLRFPLLTRLKFARAFSSLAVRQQYTCVRLYAFVVLVQACTDADDLVSFFNAEQEFINELVTLLSYEDAIPEKIRILSILSLVAICQDRTRQPTVLTAVTSGGHRGILSSLMQKAIDSVVTNSSKWSVVFVEALLSLVTVLVSSSSGCSAMREAGFIPTLLPLLKDMDPQHLHLVSMAVHVLEAFMDYSNPAAALFRDLGGLDDTILRLKVEVSHVENCSKQQITATVDLDSSESSSSQVVTETSSDLDNVQPLYSEALVAYHRRLLMKSLLRAISLGTYAPGATARISGSEESLLPQCLCIIFRRAKDFGGGVFSLAATVMSDLIHKDPTCFGALEATGLPSTFMDAIMDGVLYSSEAIICIPQCLDALCLNNNGLQTVKDNNALRCFVKIFTSRTYLRYLTGDTPGSLSSGLDELMRHASSLRGPGVDMLIEILNNIAKVGSGPESTSSADSPSCSGHVPMETDGDDKGMVLADGRDFSKLEMSDQASDAAADTSLVNAEASLPDFISNAARLLETILQNSDTCRMFVEKKGIEAVLQLFTLPLMPLSVSIGQSISIAFKNFSPQHSVSLARAVCSFLRDYLKTAVDLLVLVGGIQLVQIEAAKRSKVLRCLSSLEGLLCLASSLLKGATTVVSELGTSDADVLKDLGRVYKVTLWQISLCCDAKVDEKRNIEAEPEGAEAGVSNAGRESDNDANAVSYRYINPVTVRTSSHSQWGVEREFISVVRSSEGFNRRSRHGMSTRIRGRRAGGYLEALQIDTEVAANDSETASEDLKQKNPEVLVLETLTKFASTIRSFFTALVKGFTSPNRRRTETGSLSSASKIIGSALSKVFHEALGFSGFLDSSEHDLRLSVKCRYLGKVVDDMLALTFDVRRRTCYTVMINNFYVHGTFKELLTTFEATSQLLWTLPFRHPASGVDPEKRVEEGKLPHSLWLIDTLQSYCRLLEYFVSSPLLLSPNSASQAQLVQPVAVGLSIGLFPVPNLPEVFVRMLQSQVLDVVLPIWNHPLFPTCNPAFVSSILSLITHVYCGVGDVKRNRNGLSGSANQRLVAPPPDEATIATIVEMGFSRGRAEEALRRVETNSVEMAMEWLFSHAEDPVQEDDELARALALSLGNSSETLKVDSTEKPVDVLKEEEQIKTPPVDNILTATMKLFQGGDSMAFQLTDLLVTLCNRNKGVDRDCVISYLLQQLKLWHVNFLKDDSALCMISHTLALILCEDENARRIAVQNGIVSLAIDILMNFKARNLSADDLFGPKCISALLLILDNLLHSRPRISRETSEETTTDTLPISSEEHVSSPGSEIVGEKNSSPHSQGKGSSDIFEKIFGKCTGFLTLEESSKVLIIACDLIKQHVPALVMQAVLQLCAHLTKQHVLAMQFLENGGLIALFGLPRSCFFPGYDTLASAIIRHLIEDPQTLQMAMELEVRQTLTVHRHAGRIPVRTFLTSLSPVISRDPWVFMKAANAICQVELRGGRTTVVLLKEKDREKEKEKLKAAGVDPLLSSSDSVKISENKVSDGQMKGSKAHKKVPVNVTQVVDRLLEIVLAFPSVKTEEDFSANQNAMEVDESTANAKGKSKVHETRKAEMNNASEKSAGLAKMTFVLKLLSDILLMYVHTAGVILRRDLDMSQHRGSNQLDCSCQGGIIHHILHRLLPLTIDKNAGPDEWREKLSEKASYFLVVLSSRSGEGRKRVINELAKALSPYSNSESNSSHCSFLPNKKVLAFVDLVYAILSKNSSSSSLPSSGCSSDVAKCMIDGGIAQCLSGILQIIDLDHPDAPKIVNFIVKSLESLTRAANASEQLSKLDSLNKKKVVGGRSDENVIATLASHTTESNDNVHSQQGAIDTGGSEFQPPASSQNESDLGRDSAQSMDHEMRIEESVGANPPMELGMDFVREDMEDGGVMQNRDQIGISFHVDSRVGDDMGDEDDDMGDDGEEEEDDDDDDDGEEEDEDIGGDGNALMSLADTDVEDHDEAGLGEEYNEDMVDEDDDDFHENRVIEVRWREALDGLDHLQVFGQTGTGGGLIDVTAEPFEGVNVDDLFGLRRTFGFERRRPVNRTSFERSTTDGTSLQHPLLSRPSQSSDLVSMWSAAGSSSRDLEAFSSGNLDVSHFYMFDAPVLPYDNTPSLFGDRLSGSAAPSLADFTVGLESLRVPRRRGSSDGRWTDDGQPPAGGEAAAIAQAIEGQFVSELTCNTPNSALEMLLDNTGLPGRQNADTLQSADGQLPGDGANPVVLQNVPTQENGHGSEQLGEGHISREEAVREVVEIVSEQTCEDNRLSEPATNLSLESNPEALDIMETGEENGAGSRQLDTMHDTAVPSMYFMEDPVGFRSSDAVSSPHSLQPHNVGHPSSSVANSQSSNLTLLITGMPDASANHASSGSADVDMNGVIVERDHTYQLLSSSEVNQEEPSCRQIEVVQEGSQTDEANQNEASNGNGIDPTFLEALPEDLRAEVLASQRAQSAPPPTHTSPTAEDIDPEFLAALPPDIQAEVLAQQRAQSFSQQASGQPVEMDNASIIATFPADLRGEVLLTSSEAVLSALPSPLLAEAQMLRDRAMSHYQARSLFGSRHRFNNRRNSLGLDRHAVIDRGVGVTIGRRVSSAVAETLKLKELEGEPLLDANSLKALIRLLRLAQPLGKGLLQQLLLNLCAHSSTRAILVHLLLETIKPANEGSVGRLTEYNSLRLYGCQSNVVYGRPQLFDGLPPLLLRRILEILTYLANNHSAVASLLFYFDPSVVPDSTSLKSSETRKDKGKDKMFQVDSQSKSLGLFDEEDVPLILFLKLLSQPLFLRSIAHLEQVMGLLQVVVYTAVSKLESQSHSKEAKEYTENPSDSGNASIIQKDASLIPVESSCQDDASIASGNITSQSEKNVTISSVFLQLPQSDLHNLCSILGHEGLSDKIYMLAGEVLKKLASVAAPHRKFFITELSGLAQELSSSAVNELITLRNTNMLGLSAGSMAGAAVLRVLQTLSSFTSATKECNKDAVNDADQEEPATMWKLNVALEPLWQELSECISSMESELTQSSFSVISNINMGEHMQSPPSVSSPLPPGTQRLLPFIEAFFVLCEKLQVHNSFVQQDYGNATAREVKESAGSSVLLSNKSIADSHRKTDGTSTFTRFSEKHRRLLNAFIRQNPGLLEKSLSLLLKAPRLIDFDNKRAYFRSRIRQQHEQHLSGPLRISVRRPYVLEDSYNQLRMRPTQDLKSRLNVHFQGEEGIDAGGLTREWYQLLSRVIFDKGALLFTTVGNNATFQPNPNSVYQTEHLSYFKFVGRVVAKALFDGQLLDVYFTRSFYKHILGVKVTYHDIEAVDPDYYKNLKWMLENDVSDIPDLTFSMDADEEKHILYEKTEVTDYELKPGGRNIRVTEETKHEYVDLVADHILTNAIRPQINSFLEGFNELVPRELISIFNDKELELLISGLPEIDLDDLKANTEYTGYTAASTVVQWFWDVVKGFNKEDMAKLLQFVTGTSKVPLDGFKALQGISGPQRFQIHKAFGAPERLPSAHTCFNQLDLPEYTSREQLQDRLLLAIHEASEGFGFG